MKLTKITLACALATGMAAPQIASADDAFEFHGYARYGVQYEQDGNTKIAADGQTGNAAGRLGNEDWGGEILLQKTFESENGTKFELGTMVENWSGDNTVGLKQLYAGASNVFVAQPNAYIWGGRVFHNRIQQGLNDYYFSWADGQGVGIKGLELGSDVTMELGFVQTSTLGASDQFAFTSITNFKISDSVNMDVVADYGFSNSNIDVEDATLIGAKVNIGNQHVYVRYSDNTENDVLSNRLNDQSSVYASVEGSVPLAENTNLEYLVSVQDFDAAADSDDRLAYNAIVRPTYQWNNIHSTWIEAGYSVVDYDDAQEDNSAYKITFSQNIALGGFAWSRPMLRFFVTAGTEDNAGDKENVIIAGGMFEAWW